MPNFPELSLDAHSGMRTHWEKRYLNLLLQNFSNKILILLLFTSIILFSKSLDSISCTLNISLYLLCWLSISVRICLQIAFNFFYVYSDLLTQNTFKCLFIILGSKELVHSLEWNKLWVFVRPSFDIIIIFLFGTYKGTNSTLCAEFPNLTVTLL